MTSLIRNTEGRIFAVQIWRLVVYVDRPRYYPTWLGGCCIEVAHERVVAHHAWWRFCWAPLRGRR